MQYGSNAGLAQLTGATGAGFEKAGNQMVNLGGSFIQQDNYDNKILLDEKIRTANEKAANDLKAATKSALIAKNSVFNPVATQAINDKFGVGSEPANNALGMVDLGKPIVEPNITVKEGDRIISPSGKQLYDFPKAAATKEIKETKPAADGGNDIIYYTDGSSERSKFKMKSDWNQSNGNKSGDKIPDNYKFAGEYNIDDTLDYRLAIAGAYFTDEKSGKRYVNVDKYKILQQAQNKETK